MRKKASILQGKTIVQIIPRMESGGAEQGVLNIAEALVKAGCRALVISAGGGLVKRLEAIGAEHFTLPVHSKNPYMMMRNACLLRKIIEKEKVDLVHGRSRAPAWSALWAARLTKRPFVTTFHAAYPYANPLKKYYNSVMVRGDRVIAISSYIEQFIRERYSEFLKAGERLRCIPRGVDCERFDPYKISKQEIEALQRQWGAPGNRIVIMLPGRITRIKGHATLIKALSGLPKGKFVCLMVGGAYGHSGYRMDLDGMIQANDLASSVIFPGEEHNMPLAYALADIVVSPSLAPEGFGRVLVEAQAMGKPVIAADHGPVREIIDPNRTGWLFDPHDHERLAQLIIEAANQTSQEKARLAERARQSVIERFSLTQMCTKTLAVYEELLSDANAR